MTNKKQPNNNPLGSLHSGSIQRVERGPKAERSFPANLGSEGPVIIMNQRKDQPEQKK